MKAKFLNVPNLITLSRVVLGFVFLGLFWIVKVKQLQSVTLFYINVTSFIVFIIAIITDALDGYAARISNQVTDFGKHFDPLADSIFFIIVFCTFFIIGLMPWYFLVPVILREGFMHIYFRPHVKSTGKYLAANIYGKIKTIFQSVFSLIILALMILKEVLIAYLDREQLAIQIDSATFIAAYIFFAVIVFLSLMSLAIYMYRFYRTEKTPG